MYSGLLPKIAIVGGGTAGMMLACMLDSSQYDIHVFEQNVALGRKFLVAGDGGLNLTHAEDIAQMKQRYTPAYFIQDALKEFTNEDLRAWFAAIAIPTYVGSSKRVYPEKGIKPITVLNAIIQRMKENQVHIHTQHTWKGWHEDGSLLFYHRNQPLAFQPQHTVFALGGGSWPTTGSNSLWINYFKERNIQTSAFQSSNCAYQTQWPAGWIDQYEGVPVKNIVARVTDKTQHGEFVITRQGLEGGCIYALSPYIRAQLNEQQHATVYIDLKPNLHLDIIQQMLINKGHKTMTECLKTVLKIPAACVDYLKQTVPKSIFMEPSQLSPYLKAMPIHIYNTDALENAISTVGGISLQEVNAHYELRKMPSRYVIGEMLDWDAPTGGYLLQACFSMGFQLAEYFNTLSHQNQTNGNQ